MSEQMERLGVKYIKKYLDSQQVVSDQQIEIDRLRSLIEDLHECGDISPGLWDRIVEELSRGLQNG